MSMTGDPDVIDPVARTSQIIAAALIAGVVMMLGMSVALAPSFGARPGAGGAVGVGRAPEGDAGPGRATGPTDVGGILTWIAVAFAAAGLTLSVLIPRRITDQNRRSIAAGTWVPPSGANREAPGTPAPIGPASPQSDRGKLANVYMTQFIVGAALNEGPAFLASLAYMIESHPVALGLALLLLGALIARFPTRARIASWIEGQQELLVRDRQATT
jgi:hypothetical protein